MPVFEYQVRDASGKRMSGEKEAQDVNALIVDFKKQGYLIVNIHESRTKNKRTKNKRAKKVKVEDLMIFSRQMATMIEAGIPLVQTLDILSSQAENPTLKDVTQKIKADVEGGKNLSESLEQHSKIFPTLFVSMVRAGETSGSLDEILDRLAVYLEKINNLQKKIKSAMIYPCVVFGLAGGITTLMLTFIIPKFAEIFDSFEAPMPKPTVMLIALSNWMQANIFWLIVGGVIGFYCFRVAIKSKFGRPIWDSIVLKIPVFGLLFLKSGISKFARTLSTLIKSGVPILNALEIVSVTSGNYVLECAVKDVRSSIREGESMAEPLEKRRVFPPMVVRMIAVGEETGELEEMLAKIADFYDAQVDTAVDGLSSLLEPIIIAVLGLVIGGIVIAMFLPIFNLTQAIQM